MEVLSPTREEPAAPEPGPTVAARDIRSGTPYLLAPSTLKGLARRTVMSRDSRARCTSRWPFASPSVERPSIGAHSGTRRPSGCPSSCS